MEQNKISFEESLAFGENGEKQIALFLIEKGYNVLPLYQFEPKLTPRIFNQFKNFIAPDLMVFTDSNCSFVEVKSKQQWIKYGGVIETGCDYRHYVEYKQLSEMTKMPLHIVFNHSIDSPSGYFYVNIETKGRYWDGKNNLGEKKHRPMYFWQYNQLTKL